LPFAYLFPTAKARLDPPQRVGRTGKKTGKTFGILCRSVLKIAEADSTSVFSGIFPVLLEHAVLWVKFSSWCGLPLTSEKDS
jgi:hypothetical protein